MLISEFQRFWRAISFVFLFFFTKLAVSLWFFSLGQDSLQNIYCTDDTGVLVYSFLTRKRLSVFLKMHNYYSNASTVWKPIDIKCVSSIVLLLEWRYSTKRSMVKINRINIGDMQYCWWRSCEPMLCLVCSGGNLIQCSQLI